MIKKNYFFTIVAALAICLSILLPGCSGSSSLFRGNLTIKDSLDFKGTCIISGKVIDNNTLQPIRGANIVLLSQPVLAVTDLYGQFEIDNVLPGRYTLQVFCLGYIQQDFPDLEAKPNRLIKIEIRLDPRPIIPNPQ